MELLSEKEWFEIRAVRRTDEYDISTRFSMVMKCPRSKKGKPRALVRNITPFLLSFNLERLQQRVRHVQGLKNSYYSAYRPEKYKVIYHKVCVYARESEHMHPIYKRHYRKTILEGTWVEGIWDEDMWAI